MKNKIASAVTACGVLIAGFGAMGLSSEGQAGFVLAVKITVVGLVIAGVGQLIRKVANKKRAWHPRQVHALHQ